MIEIELKTDQYGKYYYIKGTDILHRENGPAVELANGTKVWYQHDKRHRVDGPACEYADCDYKAWYQHGKRHRLDGPACEDANGDKLWFVNNKKINCQSQQEFEKLIKLKAFW